MFESRLMDEHYSKKDEPTQDDQNEKSKTIDIPPDVLKEIEDK